MKYKALFICLIFISLILSISSAQQDLLISGAHFTYWYYNSIQSPVPMGHSEYILENTANGFTVLNSDHFFSTNFYDNKGSCRYEAKGDVLLWLDKDLNVENFTNIADGVKLNTVQPYVDFIDISVGTGGESWKTVEGTGKVYNVLADGTRIDITNAIQQNLRIQMMLQTTAEMARLRGWTGADLLNITVFEATFQERIGNFFAFKERMERNCKMDFDRFIETAKVVETEKGLDCTIQMLDKNTEVNGLEAVMLNVEFGGREALMWFGKDTRHTFLKFYSEENRAGVPIIISVDSMYGIDLLPPEYNFGGTKHDWTEAEGARYNICTKFMAPRPGG